MGLDVHTVCISDTHMRHEQLQIPRCTLLVHAGDVTRRGTMAELERFVTWFGRQPAQYRVMVAGNHDRCCELDPAGTRALCQRHDVSYLLDQAVQIEDFSIWGSPVTPRFRNMAYNRTRGASIRAHWAGIPSGLDLLITHGPPRGLGDRTVLGTHVGCDDLRDTVFEVRPRFHVFGHIHEAAGAHQAPGQPTTFLNVASCRLLSRGIREPVEFEL